MNINNISDFYQFIRSSGLINLTPVVTAFIVCMEEYGRLCPCDPQETRNAKLASCKAFYITFLSRVSPHRQTLLSKTADNSIVFANDHQYITTLSR